MERSIVGNAVAAIALPFPPVTGGCSMAIIEYHGTMAIAAWRGMLEAMGAEQPAVPVQITLFAIP